jgi:glycogen phosphorylase
MPKTTSDVLVRVRALAHNLWWTWNHDAQRLLESIDPPLWKATSHNPLKTLRMLAPERRAALESDAGFAEHLARVEAQLEKYLTTATWFEASPKRGLGVPAERSRRSRSSKAEHGRDARATKDRDLLVAYFCAEYAVHESLPQYSGGLGVLAGDHVKSASDLGLPFVAVGLLYRNGFYTHEFNADGSTSG